MRSRYFVVPVLFLVLGCGLFGKRSPVSKEQLDADIAKLTVKVDDDEEWMFAVDDARCFEAIEKEIKQTETSAEIPVMIGSYWEMDLSSGKTVYPTVIGRMRMLYKKDGEKWQFDRVEPTMLSKNTVDMDGFKNFAGMQAQLCKYHRFVKAK